MARLTYELVKAVMPHAPKARIEAALPYLNDTALTYRITTKNRVVFWLATLAQESGELRYNEELASGAAYEGRHDLGNTQKGDGVRFKGHGKIQITGRDAHEAYTNYLRKRKHLPFVDFVANPHRLAEEPYATDSAGWFVNGFKNLNPLADDNNFLGYQIKVNGMNRLTRRPNHWAERQAYMKRGMQAFPDDFVLDGKDSPKPVGFADTTDDPEPEADGSISDTLRDNVPSDTLFGGAKLFLKRVWKVLVRPFMMLYTALEAGNIYAWLGVIVAAVCIAWLVYSHRAQIKALGLKLKEKVKKYV